MLPLLSSSGVPQDATSELVAYFRDAQKRLAKIVLHPPGGTAEAQAFNAARAADQLRQVEQIIRSLRTDAATWVGTYLPIAFVDGQRRADAQMREIGVRPGDGGTSPLRGSLQRVDPHVASVFARDTYGDLAKAATSMGQRAATLLRQTRQEGLNERDINRLLAGGVIEGKPVETIRLLREELRRVHGDEVAIKTKSGGVINFEVGYYAKLVAVTKTRQATVVARHERLAANGLDLVAIVGRVSKNFCTAFLGQVFSISGRSDKYPALSSLPGGGPPFHPQCSKSTRPFVAELANARQLDDADGVADAAQLHNTTPAEAQRRFKDLQIHAQVRDRYATTAAKLFGNR